MSTFTIDPDNNITALVEVSADADKSTTFSTEKELAKLIADWPGFAADRRVELIRRRGALRRPEAD